jgi:hypothetical protein
VKYENSNDCGDDNSRDGSVAACYGAANGNASNERSSNARQERLRVLRAHERSGQRLVKKHEVLQRERLLLREEGEQGWTNSDELLRG